MVDAGAAPRWVVEQRGYVSLTSTASVHSAALAILAVADLVRVFFAGWSLFGAPASVTVPSQGPSPATGLLGLISWDARMAIYLATTTIVVSFLLRASRNARALGGSLDDGPAGLIAMFLAPVVNLFLPLIAVRQIWRASGRPGTNRASERSSAGWLIALWWVTYVIHAHGVEVVVRVWDSAERVSDGSIAASASLILAPVGVVASIMTIWLVRALARRQDCELFRR